MGQAAVAAGAIAIATVIAAADEWRLDARHFFETAPSLPASGAVSIPVLAWQWRCVIARLRHEAIGAAHSACAAKSVSDLM